MPPIYQIRCKDLHLSTAGFLRLAAMRFYYLWPKQSKGKILTSVPPNISPLFAKYLPFVCQIFATRFTKQDLQHFSRHLPHLHICWCEPMHVGVKTWFAHQISIRPVIFYGEGKILACHLALTLLWPALFSCQCECINFIRHPVKKIPSNVSLSSMCSALEKFVLLYKKVSTRYLFARKVKGMWWSCGVQQPCKNVHPHCTVVHCLIIDTILCTLDSIAVSLFTWIGRQQCYLLCTTEALDVTTFHCLSVLTFHLFTQPNATVSQ